MPSEIVMPRLSDSMEEGTVLRWLKGVGDEVAIEVLENAGYYLGLAVANAISALAPEVVVLGGGNCKPRGIFWNSIEKTARAHCHMTDVDRIEFRPALLGYEAGVIGSAIWGKKVAEGSVIPKR